MRTNLIFVALAFWIPTAAIAQQSAHRPMTVDDGLNIVRVGNALIWRAVALGGWIGD